MDQIGYSLVDNTGTEITVWGDTFGQCQGLPTDIQLPSGDWVRGAGLGQHQEWFLVPRFGTYGDNDSVSYDGTTVTVTRRVPAHLVVSERERRLALGFDYDFKDSRGVHRIGTTAADMIGWDEVTKSTQALLLLGLESQPMTIVTNTGAVTITALEWQRILIAATTFRQPIWAKSFELQAMNPIPADFASDAYWK